MRIIFPVAAVLIATCAGCVSPHSALQTARCDRHTDLQCATTTLASLEQQLAETYQHVADTQEDENIKLLAKSQREWFKFRDSYAEFASMREADAYNAQLALINQKIDSNLSRQKELSELIIAR